MALPPADDRYLEDYRVGTLEEFGDVLIEEDEVIDFARKYDPQYFHTDPVRAKDGPFGGLVASGWQTCGIFMRLMVEHFVPTHASLGSPGVDAIRWPQPVRPGDRLRAKVMILESRRSRSKPDRGIVTMRNRTLNQHGEAVQVAVVKLLVPRRPAA